MYLLLDAALKVKSTRQFFGALIFCGIVILTLFRTQLVVAKFKWSVKFHDKLRKT